MRRSSTVIHWWYIRCSIRSNHQWWKFLNRRYSDDFFLRIFCVCLFPHNRWLYTCNLNEFSWLIVDGLMHDGTSAHWDTHTHSNVERKNRIRGYFKTLSYQHIWIANTHKCVVVLKWTECLHRTYNNEINWTKLEPSSPFSAPLNWLMICAGDGGVDAKMATRLLLFLDRTRTTYASSETLLPRSEYQ